MPVEVAGVISTPPVHWAAPVAPVGAAMALHLHHLLRLQQVQLTLEEVAEVAVAVTVHPEQVVLVLLLSNILFYIMKLWM